MGKRGWRNAVRVCAAGFGCAAAGLACGEAWAGSVVRVVALSNQPAPGTDANFRGFEAPAINSNGQVVFAGLLRGPSVIQATGAGVWSDGAGWASGALDLVARTGQASPGAAGATLSALSNSPMIAGDGRVALHGFMSGGGITGNNDSAIWVRGPAGTTLAAREGGEVSGAGAGVVLAGNLPQPSFSASGRLAFRAGLGGAGVNAFNNAGVWSGPADGLELVARLGDDAAGLGGSGPRYGTLPTHNSGAPPVNGAGAIAFAGTLVGPGTTLSNNYAIWSGGAGGVGLVARMGDAAPGLGAGVTHNFLKDPAGINDAGQTAFRGLLAGVGVTGLNNYAVWVSGPGGLEAVARTGDEAPGVGGARFARFAPQPMITGDGRAVFAGDLVGGGAGPSNDSGLWSIGAGGEGRLMARAGQAVPGESGRVLGSLSTLSIAANGLGQLAFLASTSKPGESLAMGLFGVDAAGQLSLVARVGGMLDVNPDPEVSDLRQIAGLSFASGALDGNQSSGTGGEDGRRSGLSDFAGGAVTFRAMFVDGSEGVFVAAVPGPGAMGVLVVGGVWLSRRRRS